MSPCPLLQQNEAMPRVYTVRWLKEQSEGLTNACQNIHANIFPIQHTWFLQQNKKWTRTEIQTIYKQYINLIHGEFNKCHDPQLMNQIEAGYEDYNLFRNT
jgi:hypothetical protein